LLDLGRADVLHYLEERGITYRTDSTNKDPSFLRNRVRHKLIPCLDEFFPSWRKTLPDLAETQGLVRDFLKQEAAGRIRWQQKDGGLGGGEWETDRDAFFAQDEALREEALFAAVDGIGEEGRRIRRANIRVFSRGGVKALSLGGGLGIRDTGQAVQVFRKSPIWDWGFSLLIKEPGDYKLKGLTIRVTGPEVYTKGTAETGFFAGIPLVLRRNYTDDYLQEKGKRRAGDLIPKKDGAPGYAVISAEDSSGIAAFIGIGRKRCSMLLTREKEGRRVTEQDLFFFSIGGRDA
jgi:tRNA(Ile)-lysidine synthase